MNLRPALTLKHRLMIIIMVITSVALLLASVAFFTIDWERSKAASKREIEMIGNVVRWQFAAVTEIGTEDVVKAALRDLLSNERILYACILTKTRKVLADYQRPGLEQQFSPPTDQEADTPRRLGGDFVEVSKSIYREGKEGQGSPLGELYLVFDVSDLRRRQREYLRIVAVVVVVSFSIAWLLSFRIHHIITGPILDLAQTTRRVSTEKNYSIRATKRTQDELGQLFDGFNEMLAQIQERDAALQQAQRELESRVQDRTRDLRQQLTRIRLLNQITHSISERHDLDSIFGVVLHQLGEHLPVDVGCVYLFRPKTGVLQLTSFRLPEGVAAPTLAATSELGLTLDDATLRALQQGELRSAPDLSRATEPWLTALASAAAQSAVAVPLVAEGHLLGLLVVARRDQDAFQEGERDFLQGLSEHVALAAHQAQLYTELQKAYDEVRQSQEAVSQHERLRALGQMASGIAHDINNALSPVSGYADLLLDSEKNLSPSGRKYAQLIRTASDDIAQIVSRLREFYRRRRRDEPLERVRLKELVPEAIDLTRPRWRDIAQQLGVAVEVKAELASDVPEISGAASELREVLINLIFNAVDAMPKGGLIVLRSRARTLAPARGGTPSPTQVILEVQDQGVGMDEETRKRCFEPFFSTKGRRGTGLGLAMVYGVMQRHEGSIEVDTLPGRGTTMRLIFPARSATDLVKAPEPVVVPAKLPPLRILFVDDEPLLRELLREILESDGHSVVTADGGKSGLDTFRAAIRERQPFDVVITDLGMPHMDGRQLTTLLKKESPRTPVIMMTGWGALMTGETEIYAPVDGLVNKPPKMQELQAALARAIHARAASEPA